MTFFNGTTTMDAYVDLMADQLVASGFWSEPDVAFYPALATPAKRVLTDGTLFVFIQRIVTNGNANSSGGATINGTGNARFNEIKVSFGSGYNLGTHALSGTTQDCGVPLEAWQRGNSGNSFFIGDNVGSGNKTLTHFSWSDPATGSFLGYLIANGGANTYDYVVFFCLERNTTKQYADGFSNIYWTCYPAHDFEMTWSSSSTQSSRYFGKLPFNSYSTFGQYPDGTGTLIGNIGDGGNLNRPIACRRSTSRSSWAWAAASSRPTPTRCGRGLPKTPSRVRVATPASSRSSPRTARRATPRRISSSPGTTPTATPSVARSSRRRKTCGSTSVTRCTDSSMVTSSTTPHPAPR
jgi:hypothetical protein